MKVNLIASTPEPEKVVSAAARLCYSNKEVSELMDNLTQSKIEEFISNLSNLGHESPFEHISFTFSIEGVSRACSHQLVRHRISSFSQRSQRYVQEGQFDYHIPSSIRWNDDTYRIYEEAMENIQETYDELTFRLTDLGLTKKEAIEDARYVLPNACTTSLVTTMNARTLFNFFNLRCCNRAQDEIKVLAHEMLRLVKLEAPSVFRHSGRPCLKGYCPENNMQCNQFKNTIPTLDELLKK